MLLQFGDIWPIINPISHDHISSAQRGNILFPLSFILIPAGFKMAFRPRTTARNQSTGSHICAGPSREYLAMLSLLGFFADHLRIGLRLNRWSGHCSRLMDQNRPDRIHEARLSQLCKTAPISRTALNKETSDTVCSPQRHLHTGRGRPR